MAESSTDKDAAFYSSVSSNPILPQIQFEQQSDDRSSSFMISPKPEPSPYVDISELMNQQVVTLTPLANLVSVGVSKPQPVADLFSRLDRKSTEVVTLSPAESQSVVLGILRKVHQGLFDRNNCRSCEEEDIGRKVFMCASMRLGSSGLVTRTFALRHSG